MKRVTIELERYVPASEVFRLTAKEPGCAFLDSSLVNELGRWSILGLRPYKTLVKEQDGGLAAGGKKIFFKLLRLGKLDKLFTHQIIKGNFPFPPPAQLQDFIYGCVTNDYLAKGIECVLDMHLVGFIFGHGNSPSLNNSAGRQYSLLSPLDCLPAKTGGAVNDGAKRRSFYR